MSGSRSVAIFIAAFVFFGVAGFCANLSRVAFPGKAEARAVVRKTGIILKSAYTTGQAAPNIKYQTPQSYTVNIAITPLIPVNTGGLVTNGPFDKVTTMAGSGTAGSADGSGISTSFNSPHGVAVDNDGNVYVADEASSIIRKITSDGIVTTLAGSGIPGSSNGTGAAASFHNPFDIAVDAAGNLYVADSKNEKIRKVTQAGVVTDFAGNGLTGHDDGQNATFNSPAGIAIDKDGNLYVADSGNNLIRKITADGTVSTIAGSGATGNANGTGTSASFNGPIGIAVDANGNVFVADSYNHLIRKITTAGVVSTLAGSGAAGSEDGTGTAASFKDPIGLDIDPFGNLYISDTQNSKIRKITLRGVVTTIAGLGAPGNADGGLASAKFNTPFGIAIDADGNLYIGDTNNNLVRKINITKYTIDKPLPPGLVFNANTGEVSGTPTAVSPATDYQITAYNANGSGIAHLSIGVKDNAPPPPPAAPDISYVTPQVYKVKMAITALKPTNNGGAVSGDYGVSKVYSDKRFFNPQAITIDAAGNIYVLDGGTQLFKIAPDGKVTQIPEAVTDGAAGMVADPLGNLYLTSSMHDQIWKIDAAGHKTLYAGSGIRGFADGPAAVAQFSGPGAIAIDKNGNIYVGEGGNLRIRKITPGGMVTTLAGNGKQIVVNGTGAGASFFSPDGIVLDDSGNVYVADSYANVIRKITPAGEVTTYAGTGEQGSADGVASSATFFNPGGLACDNYGNIYVMDGANQKVRKISVLGIVSTLGYAATSIVTLSKDGTTLFRILNENVATIGLSGYVIDKTLPPGLKFDNKTGIISGTPTAAAPATDYHITAYNAGGSSTTTVNIEVRDDDTEILPPDISYITPQNYVVGQTIATLTPRNDGGPVPQTGYGEVTVLAGNGQKSNADGNGTAAGFDTPNAVATDPAGNIYVADKVNNIIRKITPDGTVTTLAGNGTPAVVNGKGTAASFDGPGGIATDAVGNIYVADTEGNVIRKITPDGTVTTLAGTGAAGDDNGGPGVATFNKPLGIAVDNAGFVYVTEKGGCLIRVISASGNVSRFAGGNCGNTVGTTATAMFTNPQGLAIDKIGNIYVADYGNNRVCKIDAAGKVTAFLKSSRIFNFQGLAGVTLDSQGNLYVSDSGNNQIIKVEAGTGTISALAPENNGLNLPLGIATDGNGNLYVANSNANNIIKITLTGYQIDKPLPAGLIFDKTTGIISGTPTQAYQITPFTVTAYNAGGKSSFAIEIAVQLQNSQNNIDFGPIPPKIFCDKDFDPGATSTSLITYTSSDESVAKIVGNKVHIVGAGTTTITASDGTSTFSQTLTVNPALVPLVTISPSSADDCAGNTVTYKATPQNGGDSPHYQWLVNGQPTGSDNAIFNAGNLANNDKITCVLTSSACTISPSATSNEAVFTLDPPITTAVTIASSLTGPVCAGTEITFTATPALPDLATVYQWQVNGNNAGDNNAVFTTKTLADGDIVTCIVTSLGKCLVNPVVTSIAITIKFNPVSQCVISIPNTFTPNGDGINDLWNITALAYYPDCMLNVYSRYGSLVYKSIGYGTPWDGTSGGRAVPVGTYYYILDLKDGKKPMSGSITVLK